MGGTRIVQQGQNQDQQNRDQDRARLVAYQDSRPIEAVVSEDKMELRYLSEKSMEEQLEEEFEAILRKDYNNP